MRLPAPYRPPQLASLVALASMAAVALLTPVFRLQNVSWLHALAAAVIFVVPCVGFGWVTWKRLARSRPRRHLASALGEHALRALAFSAAWTCSFSALVYVIRPDTGLGYLREGPPWQFAWGLVIYGALAQAARAHARMRERERAAANAELQALRAQLNPHFLFNTLHSLSQLAQEDPAATRDALDRFGELMRYVLDAGREGAADVALEDELAFVRNYLALERLRMGNRLKVIEDVDPDALEMAVPPLLLQPLVENAVRHGLAPLRAGGTLRLRACLTGSMLSIEVSDNGLGAEPGAWRGTQGVGLKAVTRQLQARTVDGGGLEVTAHPRRGFAVRFSIPAGLPVKAR